MPDPPKISPYRNEPDTGYFIKVELLDLRTLSLLGLLTLALIASIYLARPILMPILLAFLLHLILRPVHNTLLRFHLHRILSACLILGLLGGAVAWGIANLTEPAREWLDEIPATVRQTQWKLRELLEPVGRVTQLTEQVTELAKIEPADPAPRVQVAQGSATNLIWNTAQQVIASFSITFIMLFFMLAYGERITRNMRARSKAVVLATEIGGHVSQYLLTVTLINVGLGVCIGAALYLLGMPNAILWGVMGFVLNFIPYLGALVGVAIVFFAALIAFDSNTQIALIPLTYFALTAAEGNFITPMILGRRFTLNPIFIFLALVFWGWMWGVMGALMAVPLLMAFKIVCDHIRSLQWLSQVMSD